MTLTMLWSKILKDNFGFDQIKLRIGSNSRHHANYKCNRQNICKLCTNPLTSASFLLKIQYKSNKRCSCNLFLLYSCLSFSSSVYKYMTTIIRSRYANSLTLARISVPVTLLWMLKLKIIIKWYSKFSMAKNPCN